jgi:1-phosphatidylinositol-4-phosphate 5-kinase
MNNLLPSSLTYTELYDLKGSTFKRKASAAELQKKRPTLKDLDFMARHPLGYHLEPQTRDKLVDVLSRDCAVPYRPYLSRSIAA